MGLLFFNVGMEIGQVLFAAGMIALMRLMQRSIAMWRSDVQQRRLRAAAGYAVGALAVFWLIQRTWPLL